LLVLGARLVSGAQLIAQATQLEDAIQGADFVLTGEGKSDEQTLYGKAPHYVAELATHYGVPVVLLSGSLAGDVEGLRKQFSGCFSIINEPLSLEKAMQDAEQLLFSQTKQVIHFWNSIRKKGRSYGRIRSYCSHCHRCIIYRFCYGKIKITSIYFVDCRFIWCRNRCRFATHGCC